jgi:hypothetical protein
MKIDPTPEAAALLGRLQVQLKRCVEMGVLLDRRELAAVVSTAICILELIRERDPGEPPPDTGGLLGLLNFCKQYADRVAERN